MSSWIPLLALLWTSGSWAPEPPGPVGEAAAASMATAHSSVEPGSRAARKIAADTLAVLSGVVRLKEYRSDGVLPGAVVEVRQDGRLHRSLADGEGRYRLEGLGAGPASLSVLHVAAQPFEMDLQLPPRGRIDVDLEVDRRIIVLAGVEVSPRLPVGLNRPVEPTALSEGRAPGMGLRALEASSGMAESGLASALPGEQTGDPKQVLFMRGSAVDARMVLVDGASIHTPFHAAGLVEPFYSEFLGDAKLYLGGAPYPYDGGLSYLLDLETRPARRDRLRMSLAADGLTLSGSAELPVGSRGGVLAGGRHLHGVQGALVGTGSFPYRYDDFLVRIGGEIGDGQALRLTGFKNREGVRLDMVPDDPGGGHDAHWGNRALSLHHDGRLGPAVVRSTAAGSIYESGLPVLWEEPVLARGGSERHRLATQPALPVGEGAVRFGGALERYRFVYRLDPLGSPGISSVSTDPEEVATTGAGLFVEWEGWLSPLLHLRAGLRGDRYGHEARIRMGPRIAARFSLTDRATLLVSGGLYHQPLPAPGLRTAGVEGGIGTGAGAEDPPGKRPSNPALLLPSSG